MCVYIYIYIVSLKQMCNKGMYKHYMKYSIDISKVARFVHEVVHFSSDKVFKAP